MDEAHKAAVREDMRAFGIDVVLVSDEDLRRWSDAACGDVTAMIVNVPAAIREVEAMHGRPWPEAL